MQTTRLESVAQELRDAVRHSSPSELAEIARNRCQGEMGQFFLINVFCEAFPEIPLRQMKRASRWHGVCIGGLSDEEFNEMLRPFFDRLFLPDSPDLGIASNHRTS
jgi:hypothetical protein